MKEPVITLTLEEYEELRKEHECLEKEHAELQRKYEASLQEYSRQVEEISACTAVIADLRWKLADLTRRLWGKSSEKRHLPEDAGQLSICFESPSDVNDPVAEEQKTAGKSVTSENGYNRFRKSFTKKITPHARKPIDPSLPREEIIIPMPEGLSLEGATKLGEEVSEQYAVSPARFYVKRIIRPKYRLADGRIITAPMPVMAHPHSNASES
ncbi:MAG: IS66 family transposase, partial [Bacteroides thetaiotaomicron]